MAKTSLIVKSNRKPKFSSRQISRCQLCGRRHGYMSYFNLCRICFRDLAQKGELPGVVKTND